MSDKIFHKARLRLTAIYVASILIVLALFSVGAYLVFARNLDVDIDYEGSNREEQLKLERSVEDEAIRRLVVTLGIVDLGAAGMAIVVGWLLASSALKPIQSAFGRQKQFVSDAAHELRTPLSVMKAGLETLEVSGEPRIDDFRELNKDLMHETNRMVDLTNDLLLLTEADNLVGSVTRENVDVSAVAEKTVRLTQAYAKEAGVVIETDIEPGLSVQVRKRDIERVVLNLLKNAIDHNSRGGGVGLSVAAAGKKTVLEVSDTGIGISSEQLKNVFDRFYKADSSREGSGIGGGLGLSIVRDLVELHNGHIEIQSQLGEGTKVKVTFG